MTLNSLALYYLNTEKDSLDIHPFIDLQDFRKSEVFQDFHPNCMSDKIIGIKNTKNLKIKSLYIKDVLNYLMNELKFCHDFVLVKEDSIGWVLYGNYWQKDDVQEMPLSFIPKFNKNFWLLSMDECYSFLNDKDIVLSHSKDIDTQIEMVEYRQKYLLKINNLMEKTLNKR